MKHSYQAKPGYAVYEKRVSAPSGKTKQRKQSEPYSFWK